ncbi:MAG TPA: membrane protein [Firmicutes bacterium]|nr:membrane protein [Bacillota bacterium]
MKLFIRIIVFTIGLTILSLGAVLLSKTGLGISSWDAINFGLSGLFGLTPGTWVSISSLIVLSIAALMQRKMINLISFVIGIITGFFIDGWIYILAAMTLDTTLLQWGVFVIALLVLALGIAIYLLPKFPPGPIDFLMVVVKDKYHLKLMYAKLIIDFICLIVAFFARGPVGLTTILIAFLLGPLINLWQSILIKLMPSLSFDEIK